MTPAPFPVQATGFALCTLFFAILVNLLSFTVEQPGRLVIFITTSALILAGVVWAIVALAGVQKPVAQLTFANQRREDGRI